MSDLPNIDQLLDPVIIVDKKNSENTYFLLDLRLPKVSTQQPKKILDNGCKHFQTIIT